MENTDSTRPPEFHGAYVREVRDVLLAAIMAQKNVVLLSAPGWGKTRIAKKLSTDIAGDGSIFKRLEGSTPPDDVKGMIDPEKALQSPPKFERNITGTPYDPKAKIVVMDEIFRPSDPVFDLLVDILDRQDVNPDEAPVVIGTSNFVIKNQRTNAVIDRVALWLWIRKQSLDVDSLVDVIARRERGTDLAIPTNGRALPTWDEVLEVRNYKPDDATIQAIKTLLETLVVECVANNKDVNPRRLTHWFEILYYYTAWLKESPTFTDIPPQAATVLRFAFPTLSMKEWQDWDVIARAVGDPLKAALDSAKNQAYESFKDIMQKNLPASELAMELGTVLAGVQSTLNELKKESDDQRIGEILTEISGTYSQVLNGQNPFEV
jgi:MoxR-like ATPase